ncbi:hypothetical protein [Falsarthrobacter nasiphocae]|uniref:Uncharacterized protein n=1 Tax=Falsarthrobacter nasiphocae TaxID=189863 RepID=A0AAE4C797_9MICC|nr:hypothetical protein [Falsarthrobacter nasiphocae]MDR6892329.1 hypothetical protein [Falsarthrobacter nasiphocae]
MLVKNSSPANFPSRAGKIAALIRAENARRPVRATFLHEDCDEVEPAHERVAKTIEESSLAKSHHIHAVTPAWEMESWVFLWPEAVTAYRPSWKLSNSYRSRSTGMIANAKETLTRDLDSNSPGRGTPKYRESDLPGIMEKVRTEGLIDQRRAQSRSFDAFRDAAACPTCDLRTLAESP